MMAIMATFGGFPAAMRALYLAVRSGLKRVSVVRTFGATRGVNQRSVGLVWGVMLGGELAVLQAPMLDGLSFDPFTLLDDACSPAEVGVGGRYVVQALVVALMIVVLDERLDLSLKVVGQEVVFQQDAVLVRGGDKSGHRLGWFLFGTAGDVFGVDNLQRYGASCLPRATAGARRRGFSG